MDKTTPYGKALSLGSRRRNLFVDLWRFAIFIFAFRPFAEIFFRSLQMAKMMEQKCLLLRSVCLCEYVNLLKLIELGKFIAMNTLKCFWQCGKWIFVQVSSEFIHRGLRFIAYGFTFVGVCGGKLFVRTLALKHLQEISPPLKFHEFFMLLTNEIWFF